MLPDPIRRARNRSWCRFFVCRFPKKARLYQRFLNTPSQCSTKNRSLRRCDTRSPFESSSMPAVCVSGGREAHSSSRYCSWWCPERRCTERSLCRRWRAVHKGGGKRRQGCSTGYRFCGSQRILLVVCIYCMVRSPHGGHRRTDIRRRTTQYLGSSQKEKKVFQQKERW